MRCPCRKKSETTTYDGCCQPYHTGLQVPLTAEALMRSRYTAFVRLDSRYLSETWHPSTRPARIDFTPDQEWQLLRIIETQSEGDAATVEFSARSRIAGRSQLHHEASRFVRERGRWFYLDGATPAG